MNHSLERTSPKGQAFVGTCVLCGKEGLTAAQAQEDCPNPKGISEQQVLIETIDGKEKENDRG